MVCPGLLFVKTTFFLKITFLNFIFRMGNKDTDTCQNMEGQRLQKAVEEAKQTQKLTPLIKEELRLSILNRRCLENKGEIELDEKKPVIKSVSMHLHGFECSPSWRNNF